MLIDVGERAPDFALKDQNNQQLRLADFNGRRHVLLVFYPLAFTGRCQGELGEIRDNLVAYANEAAQILTVSVDSVYSHKVWADREGYTFPLLSDFWPHGAVADAYGVLDQVTGVAHRATFVIDMQGVVRFREMVSPGETREQSVWRSLLADVTS